MPQYYFEGAMTPQHVHLRVEECPESPNDDPSLVEPKGQMSKFGLDGLGLQGC